jgi:hypothetical protein
MTIDLATAIAGVVFIVLFCLWASHVMHKRRTTPKVPRDRRSGRTIWGIGFGPFWWWFN